MVKRDGFYKRGRFWTCSTDPITGREKSTKCTDLTAAKAWKAERERRKHNPAYARSTTATFGEWVKKVIAHKAVKLKPISLRLYPQYYGHWARIVPAATVLSEIDSGTYDEFILLRRTDGVEDSTIGRELTAMSTLLRLAKRAGCYPGDLESLRPVDFDATGRQGERMLTPEEFLKLVPKLNPNELAFVCVAIALGCRRSEVFHVEAIDADATTVFIAGTKTEESRRTVPILSVFRPLLTAVRHNIPVPKTCEKNIGRSLWDACDAAGIPRCCPNDLRRTHASWLKEADVDSDVVRRLMGHKNSELVNTVYGRPRVEKLAASAERSIQNSPNLHDIKALPEPRKANTPRNPSSTKGAQGLT
jgi:integrase